MSKLGGSSNAWSIKTLKTQCKSQNGSIIESGIPLQKAFNPISTGGGVFHPPICFFASNFFVLEPIDLSRVA